MAPVTRTRVRWGKIAWLLVLAAVAVALFAGTAGAGSGRVQPIRLQSHVVVRGETVWSIAKTIAREQDPRPIVADIIDLNRIENAAIFPGQVLRVPPAG